MAKFVGGTRNFGYGKQMGYAGANALRELYQGHFDTVHSHAERWGQFAAWAKENGIRDSAKVTNETLQQYGTVLKERVGRGALSVSYAQNLLSSANVTLSALRGDRRIGISPSQSVGRRSTVRESAPNMDRLSVAQAALRLRENAHERAACVVELTRALGLREKEAILLNLPKALSSAEKTGQINVQEGTKGGRSADRFVPVSATAKAALQSAVVAANGTKNLISPALNYHQFRNYVQNVALPVLAATTQGHIHDLRAAYACERYQQLTGYPAPVIAGARQADKRSDEAARRQIAHELGHNRINVTAEYLGSSR